MFPCHESKYAPKPGACNRERPTAANHFNRAVAPTNRRPCRPEFLNITPLREDYLRKPAMSQRKDTTTLAPISISLNFERKDQYVQKPPLLKELPTHKHPSPTKLEYRHPVDQKAAPRMAPPSFPQIASQHQRQLQIIVGVAFATVAQPSPSGTSNQTNCQNPPLDAQLQSSKLIAQSSKLKAQNFPDPFRTL